MTARKLYKLQGLSKNDTTALKAVGIFLIVLHNYFHSFPSWGLENEFAFSAAKFEFFRTHLSPNFYNDLGLLFSFWGHYGVQIFVFLSAYGLYTSYRNKPLRYGAFVRNRVWKLWPAFFLAVLLLIALTIITTRRFNHYDLYIGSLLRLSLLSNLIPAKSFDVVGPWWFYSMIVQFYLAFPLLRNWFNRYGPTPLILLSVSSWIVQMLFTSKLNVLGWNLNTLVIGHLPVFSLGLLLAKYQNFKISIWIFFAAVILFVLGNLYQPAWVFSQLCVTIIFLYIYRVLKKSVASSFKRIRKPVFFVGNLSMYLFAVNGFLRHPFIQQVLRHPTEAVRYGVLIAFLIFVVLVALFLRWMEKLFLHAFSKTHTHSLAAKAV